MRKLLGIIISAVMIGAFVSLNSTNIKSNEVTLSNIAALSVAQAEGSGVNYCLLISMDLCYINTWTNPVTVIYGEWEEF